MIKSLFPLLNLLMAIILQVLPGGISVKMDVPAQVNAGSEFEVKITLDKGDLESFSRFQQAIPAGLTALSGTSAYADFTFEENRVRLIWLKMPADEVLTFTYKVKVDERLKGTFDLTGQFSYIDDNERKIVNVSPVSISIVPSPDIDPSLTVDINEFEKGELPYISPFEGVSDLACIRQEPVPEKDGTYIVHLLVNKNDRKQFAKIEESIPSGYTASSIDPKQAIFTFSNQTAKFLWMNLPAEAYFTVSYKLIPRNQTALPAPEITGKFSFMADEKTVTVDIPERQTNLLALGRDEVYDLLNQTLNVPEVEALESPDVLASAATVTAREEENANATQPGEPVTGILQSSDTRRLDTEEGVYYRIQVAAGHKPVNINRYFSRLKIEMEVTSEVHDGWQKYSVGSFTEYREARDYRTHIWNTTPVKDAFVTAYSDGSRITVQEALMITDQKWLQ